MGNFLSISFAPSRYRKIIFAEDRAFNYTHKNIEQLNEHIVNSISDSLNFIFGDKRVEFSYFTPDGKKISTYTLTAVPYREKTMLLDEILRDSSSTDSKAAGNMIINRINQLIPLDTSAVNIISFSTSNCAPCKSQHKTLEKIYMFDNTIKITYISSDSLFVDNAIVIKKSKLNEIGVHAFPTNVIFVPGHRIVYAGIGAIPYNTLIRLLTPFL